MTLGPNRGGPPIIPDDASRAANEHEAKVAAAELRRQARGERESLVARLLRRLGRGSATGR